MDATISSLMLCIPRPLCDLGDLFEHGSSRSGADPVSDAFAAALVVGFAISLLGSVAVGGMLALLTRRIRHIFWLIPLVNLSAYLVYLFSREYPNGRSAQFQGRGLLYTVIGIILLLLVSLIVAAILALIRVVIRWRKRGASTH